MRVAIDATPLTVPTGGVRRYVEELSSALDRVFPEDEWLLLSDQLSRPASWLERRWWLWGASREMERRGAELFHGTDFAVPYLPHKPAVMTVHDLSPWRKETREQTSLRVRRRTPVLLRLGLARIVITPTEAVRREAIRYFGLSPERVVAVPLAASAFFQPQVSVLGGTPYFLYVGTIERRKNLQIVVDCWSELRKSEPVELVIAGRVRDRIDFRGARVLGETAERDLPGLYSGAAAVLYPSTYEGFGLPVLEAMQCGAMVITSTDPAISEVAADSAVRIDCRDARAWFEAMRSSLNRATRAEWGTRGLRRAAAFSWERTARLTRMVYGEALRRT